MPKPTQKQKLQKADFSKAKLKLGKGKQQPSNATNTSFKARSIALPGQSIRTRTDHGEPVSAGGLVLDEVIIRTRHPNAGVKRDALQGIKDILQDDATRESAKVVATLSSLLADEDASVRKALRGLLAWYLPMARPVLAPHLPMLALVTSSALSHIFAEVRLDAARVVSLLLEHALLERTDAHGILQGLCLAAGSNPPAPHKLVYLEAIERYVRYSEESIASGIAPRAVHGHLLPIPAGGSLSWQITPDTDTPATSHATVSV